jgi:hypothetical protein
MGAFAILKKNRVELNLNFFRVAVWKKTGFYKVNEGKNWVPAQKKIWLVATLVHALENLRWHPQNIFPGAD